MNKNDKIYITGHRCMAGSAIHRNLEARGCTNRMTRTHSEPDLTDQWWDKLINYNKIQSIICYNDEPEM